MRFNKLFLAVGLFLTIAMNSGCVDVPSEPSTNKNPDFRSQARFVHGAPSVSSGNVTVDGATVSPPLAFKAATSYMDIASGSRAIVFGSNAAQTVSFGSEQQSTVVIYTESGSSVPAFLNLAEGHKDKNYGVPGKALVKFVNVAQGSAANLTFRLDSVSAANVSDGVSFKSNPGYKTITPGSHAVYTLSDGGFIATIEGAQEVPAVTTNTKGSGTVTLTVAGALKYKAEIKSDNSRGLFTGAHFHNAATGVTGPVVYTINTDSQYVPIPSVSLSGANEVPATTSKSKGTATITFDSKSGLGYSVAVTAYNSEGFFTGAHFHNAAAGVIGSVVNTIDVTKQKISFPPDTLKGVFSVPADTTFAKGYGTFTLYKDSLVYSVRVVRDTVDTMFTGGHFHNAAAGATGPVVRTITSTSFWAKDTTFKGTWKTTDTEPLTSTLLSELIAGKIYVNFHTTKYPSGAIRAQLVPDSTTTNTFAGTWSDATLTFALKNELVFGKLYLNFHTAANAGGAIRGQILPEAYSTNVFAGTWSDTTLTATLKEEFNKENIYFNFHTAGNAGGEVRGQVKVDPSGGQYGYTTMAASAFDAGRMYTVIATGKGATFQLIKLADRQYGLSKTGSAVEAKKAETKKIQNKTNSDQ